MQFFDEEHSRYLTGLKNHGKHVKTLNIELNQTEKYNRTNSCEALNQIAEMNDRKLENLKIKFCGENPLFYAGIEYVNSLKGLFGVRLDDSNSTNNLKQVDLSGLTVMFDDHLFDILSEHSPHLEKLNMQNKVLICKVTPTSILTLVKRCRKLKELHIFMCSVSEDILLAFTEEDRKPLKLLSLVCRREEKYHKDLSDDAWKILTRKLPDFRVTLIFDHTCPMHKINEIMCPSIPLKTLRLETFSNIYDQINTATRYYKSTLEKLVVETPMSKVVPELNKALLELVTDCNILKSLHVFCVLEKETVEKILALKPDMKSNNTYTLKYTAEPHPWVAGKDALR